MLKNLQSRILRQIVATYAFFQHPGVAWGAMVLSAVVLLYVLAVLVAVAVVRVPAEGRVYVVVTAGMGVVAVMRMTWGILGLVGAGPHLGTPVLVPQLLTRLGPALVCVILW